MAEKVNGIVAPCLEIGQSKSLTSFPGTIAISSETLRAVYSEIVENFIRLGCPIKIQHQVWTDWLVAVDSEFHR